MAAILGALALAVPACVLDWGTYRGGAGARDGGGGADAEREPEASAEGAADEDAEADAAPDEGAPCTPRFLVNELQAAGGAGPADEFVELYNAADCDGSLEGWTLRYSSAGGSTPLILWTGGKGDALAARGFAVLAGQSFPKPAMGARFPNGTTGSLAAGGGGVGLFAPGAASPTDSVAYASLTNPAHPFVRPSGAGAAPNPPAAQSIGRVPDGTNSDTSAADFVLTKPTPGAPNAR